MADQKRQPYLDALQNGWGTYLERVKRLSSKDQADFLKKQGYACLGDLLGHVVAWWETGMPDVEKRLFYTDSPVQEYDVDDFNARAVARFSKFDESDVIQTFENKRKEWIKLVENLPDEAFSNQKLVSRLNIELIGHLEEHKLP